MDIYIFDSYDENWVNMGPYYEAGPEIVQNAVTGIGGTSIIRSFITRSGNVVRVSLILSLALNSNARMFGGRIARLPVGSAPMANPNANAPLANNPVTGYLRALIVSDPDNQNYFFRRESADCLFTIDTGGYIRIPPFDVSDELYLDAIYIAEAEDNS